MDQYRTDLAVIESRWWEDGNSSIRGLFDLLSDILAGYPGDYHYEMFNNQQSLKEIILRATERYRNIYIAAHGDGNTICGAESREENNISRAQLKNIIKATTELPREKQRLRGLFFGSCKFTNMHNAKFLLGEDTEVCWVAGYSKKINFINSSIVDMFFWNTYYRRVQSGDVSGRVKLVAKEIDKFMPGAHKKLGFNIFLKDGQGIRPLLPIQDSRQ